MSAPRWISKGFWLAGAANLGGVLLFSKGFTNTYLGELDPQVLSTFGLVGICLWGLAYIAVAESYRAVKWLVAVFAVEKVIYFGVWVLWMAQHRTQLPTIFEASPLTATFLSIYGLNDLLFAVFFGWVFLHIHRDG